MGLKWIPEFNDEQLMQLSGLKWTDFIDLVHFKTLLFLFMDLTHEYFIFKQFGPERPGAVMIWNSDTLKVSVSTGYEFDIFQIDNLVDVNFYIFNL